MRAPFIGVLGKGLNQPIPTAQTWVPGGGTGGWNSTFGGVSPFYDAPPARTTADTADCLFDIPNVQSIAASGAYVIPPGSGYVVLGATSQLEAQVGTAGTWVAISAAAASQSYWADGVNIRVHNTGGAAASTTLYPIR